MIEIKTYSKQKKTGGSGGSSSPTKYISGVISEAEHAGRADKAKRAEVADQANYAGTAASAQNAAYASEAGNLHADAEILQKYLSLEDTVDPQVVKGMVIFAKGLIAKALVDLEMGAKFGNNAKITNLGEAVFSSIKSLDYDNAAEQGFSVEKEENGKYHAFFTNLTIWGKAIFHELEIRKLSYSGGNIYLSGAGSKLIKVVPVKKMVSADGVTSWVEKTEEDTEYFGWKCYLLADNGTTATMNYWQDGDQVRCQTMGEIAAGGAYSDVSNKSYWRTIPNGGVSTQNEKIYVTKTETYLDEDGNEQTREVQVELYDGQAFAWIVIGKHCRDIDGYDDEFSVGYDGNNPAPLETRDIPSAGDTIVLDGNRHRNKQGEYDKTDRQNVIILETTGEYAPRIACYANITEYKHTFTKRVNGSDKEVSLSVFETSPKGGTKINSSRFEWISDDGSTINIINYQGDWDRNNTYHKNDQVNHNNAVWVCVANSGVDVTEEPSDGATYWKKVLSGGKGEKGDDAVTYTLEASPGYIRLSSDGSIDYTNGYINKGDEYGSDKYLVVRGYKVVKGVRDNRFSTEASPVTLRLTINDGSAYSEYTPSDGDSVSIDFEPKYEDSYYSMLQEISHSGLNSVRVDLCEGSEYNPNKILATCDIPIIQNGKDGQKGDDGASYNINFVTYKDDVHNDTILYVYVVRSVGKESTSTLISKIPEISETTGLEVRVYCDGDYNENLTNHVKWSGSIQRSAWETVKNFEVRLYLDDKLVSSNSYSFGEQGESALEIIVTPETLAFDTNDYGVVPPETSKQASISCYRNGVKVTNVSYLKSAEENCLASVSESNGSATVTISKITSQEVADDSGNSSTISNTNGYATIQVWDKDTNLYHRVQVKFMVNVAKFTGQMVNTNKQFSKTLTEVGNKVNSFDLNEFKAEIKQTAREISLSVSEKSIGRRNLLVGSAFLREDNHYILSNDARIEMNSGYQGTNCIHVFDATEAGNPHYVGAYWDGSQGGRSVKIEKGKKYTMSCFYKTNDTNAKFSLEAIYTDKETNAKRLGRPKFLSPSYFNPKYNQWELFTTVIDTTDAESDYIAFNFWEYCNVNAGRINAYICRLMVEEGDTYNGWTLSQDDYDIIGANLIDNSRTLDTGGNVIEAKGQKALVGDAYELTYIGSDDYNTFYKIKGSTFKLNTDYTISFEVRGDAKYMGVYAKYPITNTKFTLCAEPQNGAMTEVTDGGKVDNYVALIQVKELSKQQRVWSHFRFKDRLPGHIYFQFPKNADQIGVTSWSVTITRPKIEVGAVVTEYTERKSDLVDKASLKAAGIEVTSKKVKLYGDQIEVKPKKDGNDVYALFGSDGFINTNILNVQHVYAKNTNGTVYGHFGYLGAEGGTDNAGNQYPLWVGASNVENAPFSVRSDGYMVTTSGRIGAWSLTERNLTTGAVVDSNYGTYMGTCLSMNEIDTANSINECKFLVAMGKGALYYDPFSPLKSGFYEDAKFRGNASERSDRYHVNSNNEHTYLSRSHYSSMYIKKEIGENSSSSRVDINQPALLVDSDGVGITSPGGNFFGGLAIGVLEAETTTDGQDASSSIREQLDDNRGAFVAINNAPGKITKFYLPKYPQEGQMLMVLQINSGTIRFYASNSKLMAFNNTLYQSGQYWTSLTQGQFSVFVYANGAWRIQFMNGR